MKSLKFVVGLAIFFLFGCNRHYVNSTYPIPSKQLFKKQLHYKNKYGYIDTFGDTTINDGELCKIYKRGVLNKIGKIDIDKPIGYWFVFKDSLELEYIVRYSANKIDSFYHPFSIVQQRW